MTGFFLRTGQRPSVAERMDMAPFRVGPFSGWWSMIAAVALAVIIVSLSVAPAAAAEGSTSVPPGANSVSDSAPSESVTDEPAAVAIELPPPERFDLFLLVGQSNMAGRGRVSDDDRRPPQRVLMLAADGSWQPATDPMHFDKPSVVGVGLGRTFGIELAQLQPDRTIGLIPCAVGGSPISAWRPGEYYPPTQSHPWDDAIARAEIARQHGTLRGILWHQGESDGNPQDAAEYEQRLHDLISRFRDVLESPDVPFLVGQLGQFPQRPWNRWRQLVDRAHRQLPTKIADTAFVSSDGLIHGGDHVHFDADSYRELGRRYAAAYRRWLPAEQHDVARVAFSLDLQLAHQGFDGRNCWVHARAGVIPTAAGADAGAEIDGAAPLAVMTTQRLELSGSDVFHPLHTMTSRDGGAGWSQPLVQPAFERRWQGTGTEILVSDFTPQWHAASQRLLGTGHTVWYGNNRVLRTFPRAVAYAVYDAQRTQWNDWHSLELPAGETADSLQFLNAGAGSGQRYDLPGGDILLPIYCKRPDQSRYSVTVLRCSFDGQRLVYQQHGNLLTVDQGRGLYEPSITRFSGRYYLTMRNDQTGYVSVSDDGLFFSPPQPWCWEDGSDLGNYNTQQHWVTHRDALYLVYTRRGADNDHVFRHRAPLFIAQVDPWRLSVLRDTEQVLIPQAGARLGNFGVTTVSDREVWVTAAEWMQPLGVERYGSDNRIFVARLRWPQP